MRWPVELRLRLRSLFQRDRVEQELDEELQFHMEQESLSKAQAARVMEECRDARGTRWIENTFQDLRYGLRLMRKSPGFAAAAVLTIGIGIAAATGIFSVVYGVTLQPLPYREPERLVSIWSRAPRMDMARTQVAAANWRDWREQSSTLEDIALVRHIANYNLTGEGEPERLVGARVTANLFGILGVTPAIGRVFTKENEQPADSGVVVLSDGLWRRRFGADPGIVGRMIRLNGEPYTVLGVMRPQFRYPAREFELWAPLPVMPSELKDRYPYNYLAVGRLKPGVTLAQAQADLDTISSRLARTYSKENEGIFAGIAPLLDDIVRPVSSALYILLGAVGCLLLIGAVNVANLLLARGLARGRERAVRAALGASAGRLMAQAVVEVTPIVTAGASLGIAGAAVGLRALVAILPGTMPRTDEIRMSLPVFGFSLLMLVATSLLVAFWPALQTAGTRIADPLRGGGRANSSSRGQSRLREFLVVTEIALTVMLVAGACLLFRSFTQVRRVDAGFQPARALTMHLAITRQKYPEDRDIAAFISRVLEQVRAMPGVVAVGMVNRLPIIGGAQDGPIQFEGENLPVSRYGSTDWRTATPDYFRAIGIPLIEGRFLAESDVEGAKYVGLIDEVTARKVWPNQSAVGKRFRAIAGMPWAEIVGVVGRIRHDGLDAETRPQVYWNYKQRAQDRMALVVRTGGEPANWAAPVVAQIRGLDPDQPVYSVFTMDDIIDRSLSQRKLNAVLVAVFAGVSLLLAAIGIYGVVAYSVQQRVREFGIRLALGANRGDVTRMVVLRAAAIAGIGSALGLAAAGALGRFLQTVLFEVSATDAVSYAAAAVVLIAVAVAASYVPVRRALAMDPMQSLRAD